LNGVLFKLTGRASLMLSSKPVTGRQAGGERPRW
jgi:hypothetical protein